MENVTAEMIKADFNFTADQITKKFQSTSGRVRKEMEIKAKRLKDLGFKNTTEVRDYHIIEDALKTIREFSPYKFITEEAVESICKKYGLLFGSSERYLGEIPEKNLRDIEAFEAYQKNMEERKKREERETWPSKSAPSHYPDPLEYLHREMMGSWTPRFEGGGILQALNLAMSPKYHIAAPINMMQHDEDEVKDGYKIMDDPIVFKQVPVGYLIITAWGPEAQDPKVFNHIQN